MKQKKGNSFLVPIVLIIMGTIISSVQFVSHAPEYLMAALTFVRHPSTPDFSKTDQLLKEVVKNGLVDYDKVRSTPYLNQALAEIAGQSPDKFTQKDDQLAFWINACNVVSLKIQTDSSSDRTAPIMRPDFRVRRFTVAGKAYTVEEMVEEKITPFFLPEDKGKAKDKRAFLLLTRSYLGDPPLVDHAITAETMQHDMEANTKAYLSMSDVAQYSESKGLLIISPYFRLHSKIFSRDTGNPAIFVIDNLLPDLENNPDYDFFPRMDYRINALPKNAR